MQAVTCSFSLSSAQPGPPPCIVFCSRPCSLSPALTCRIKSSPVNALLGVIIGGGILWALAWASPYLFGKEGMGGGDIKLLAMIGAFLGWKPALLTIMIGSLAGSIIGIALIAFRFMKREEYIPFGPFLVFGALVSMFFAQPLVDWYQRLLTPSF